MLPTESIPPVALAIVMCVGLGCTGSGVAMRPDGSPGPQNCTDDALKAMKILRLRPGDSSSIVIDANQTDQNPVTLYDGPVESYLTEWLGSLPPVTRLYGQVWTSGPNVVIRYYEVRPPDGDTIPLCAVARLARGGLQKKPGARPGVAVLDYARAGVFIVDAFR